VICGPADHALPYKERADEAKKRVLVQSISEAQVGRYLRETELQPHKSRHWLNAHEKEGRNQTGLCSR
jgi:hypothetical protein